jgi:predicted TPR repeat methyltransferase
MLNKSKMTIQQAYNSWAAQYDTNKNKTRDLEGQTLRQTVDALFAEKKLEYCLEIGCGTGKNTEYLVQKAQSLTSVDFSEEMLAKAKEKITSDTVQFVQADITKPWFFATNRYDLVSFSLVLEHIEDLGAIFSKVASTLNIGGYVYIGELHPFKQYAGTKARFDTPDGERYELECYTHNISDFLEAAQQHGLQLIALAEHFDDDNRTEIPRILSLVFEGCNYLGHY